MSKQIKTKHKLLLEESIRSCENAFAYGRILEEMSSSKILGDFSVFCRTREFINSVDTFINFHFDSAPIILKSIDCENVSEIFNVLDDDNCMISLQNLRFKNYDLSLLAIMATMFVSSDFKDFTSPEEDFSLILTVRDLTSSSTKFSVVFNPYDHLENDGTTYKDLRVVFLAYLLSLFETAGYYNSSKSDEIGISILWARK